VFGSDANDEIYGGVGRDQVIGMGGDDLLVGGGDPLDSLWFSAQSGPVTVDLQAGTAIGEGSDSIQGFGVVEGTTFSDTMYGSSGADTFYGAGGADLISGRAGGDEIHGGAGDDRLLGVNGKDYLFGERANDKARRRAGARLLRRRSREGRQLRPV
jgi:Ca2+-binding RTX toxin-like protein